MQAVNRLIICCYATQNVSFGTVDCTFADDNVQLEAMVQLSWAAPFDPEKPIVNPFTFDIFSKIPRQEL